MVNKQLIHFIKESRKRGFEDSQIRAPLMEDGWPIDQVDAAFNVLGNNSLKNKVCLYIDSAVLKKLDARARRNLFTLAEQIEDILRRSALNAKSTSKEEKLDDVLVGVFSRKRHGKGK